MEQKKEIPKRKRAPGPRIYGENMVYSLPRKSEDIFTEAKRQATKIVGENQCR
jgi:hypothetical protein